MLHPVTFRSLAVAACGWLLACDVAALSLGRARGAVLIGRPLELTVPVTVDAGEENPCAHVDLFYGENRVNRGVGVRFEPTTGGQGVLRVTSSVAVDEPMVTVYLRAGCNNPSSRRYVLLSELPPEVEPTPATRPTVPVPQVAPGTRAAAPAAPARTPPRAVPRAAPQVAQAPASGQGEAAAAKAPARAAAAAPPVRARQRSETPAAPPRARLRLEPLDLSVDRDPTLHLTSELRSQLASDPQQRVAAAALWQMLQKTPDEILQDAVRLQGAERELKSLRDATQQNTASITQIRRQVDAAQSNRGMATALVTALSVLLAGLLAWLAWRWSREERMARVGRWFEANSEMAEPPLPIVDAAAARRSTAPMPPTVSPASAAHSVRTPPPVRAPAPAPAKAAAPAPVAAVAAQAPPVTAWPAADEFHSSRGGLRMAGVEELIDVHDKADFFLSIGEHDQAIGALETHVHDQVETSALAWMDLLELYHRFGKRVEYERLRTEFHQRFTVQVPDFEHFDQPTASLENYSRALSRIVALWPSRRVLDVIEESIFRKPGLPGADPFSLEAYRDLVLLYHIASDMAPPETRARPAGPTSNFRDTSLQPLNALDTPDPSRTDIDIDRLLIPPASPRLGVDIELGRDAAPAREELPALDLDIGSYENLDATRPERKRG